MFGSSFADAISSLLNSIFKFKMVQSTDTPPYLSPYLPLLKALGHPLRLEIVNFIHQHHEVSVHTIYSSLKLEQSITSQHLKMMREAGVVVARKTERFVFYSVNYEVVNQFGAFLSGLNPLK